MSNHFILQMQRTFQATLDVHVQVVGEIADEASFYADLNQYLADDEFVLPAACDVRLETSWLPGTCRLDTVPGRYEITATCRDGKWEFAAGNPHDDVRRLLAQFGIAGDLEQLNFFRELVLQDPQVFEKVAERLAPTTQLSKPAEVPVSSAIPTHVTAVTTGVQLSAEPIVQTLGLPLAAADWQAAESLLQVGGVVTTKQPQPLVTVDLDQDEQHHVLIELQGNESGWWIVASLLDSMGRIQQTCKPSKSLEQSFVFSLPGRQVTVQIVRG